MPLVLAITNHNALVTASDMDSPDPVAGHFGQLMPLPSHAVLLMAGNLEAAHDIISRIVLPKVNPELSAAGLATIIQAALVQELVPKLPEMPGRLEIIVAGLDPVQHVARPDLYYLDSARDFYLKVLASHFVAAGSTAVAIPMLSGHDYAADTAASLRTLAKECYTATTLRWPGSVKSHLQIATVTPQSTEIENF